MEERKFFRLPSPIEWVALTLIFGGLWASRSGPIPDCTGPDQEELESILESTRGVIRDNWEEVRGAMSAEEFLSDLYDAHTNYDREQFYPVQGNWFLLGIIGEDGILSTADDRYYFLSLE